MRPVVYQNENVGFIYNHIRIENSSTDRVAYCFSYRNACMEFFSDFLSQLMPMGNRLAELARMRLEYDAARKKIQNIQQRLADLEEKVTPGQAESDRDR